MAAVSILRSGWQRGFTMIEVLVTIFILMIGLLGLAGLQARLQVSEMEAYQRAQALILLNDMASRISANRGNAAAYAALAPVADPLGTGRDCAAIGTGSTLRDDAGEWCAALQGAAETSASGRVGAMLGGRGCVEDLYGGQYMVTVAWQGLTPISAPPASVACGRNTYDSPGTHCEGDRCRRAITTIVRIADLAS